MTRDWLGKASSPVPQPVVIPSVSFSDFLQVQIADRFGVCMGIDFLTPQDFIRRATGPQAEKAWSKSHLTWRILPHIGAFSSKLGVSDPSPRDRFALAGLIADQFDQYGHFRPEILKSWAADQSALKDGMSDAAVSDESWQRELWGRLRLTADGPPPSEQLESLKRDAKFREDLVRRFPRLLVLGSGVIDPLLVQMLELLADSGGMVEVHVLLPSLEFLGDLRTRRALPPVEKDPEEIEFSSTHPLLESMGRHAVGTFLLLGRLDDQYTHWPEAGVSPPPEGDLLQRMQADIRGLHEPSTAEVRAGDRSIQVHSCFGARREMEILKDEILRAFRELPDLKPEDIHVITPSLETYAPLVGAVLEQGIPGLAIRLMESPVGERDPVIEALLSLLEIANGGRFEASWLMELVQMDAVQKALGVFGEDRGVESLRSWIRESGVTHGLGDDGSAVGEWGFARDRLVAGRWFGPNEAIKYPEGTFVLPIAAQLAGSEELKGRFVGWFAALEELMREWETMASAGEWEARIRRACEVLLVREDDEIMVLLPHLAFLREAGSDEAVDAGTILDWLQAGSKESGRRSRVSGRIAFGQFKQLQNIPCRVLAMVGMQDGAFPGQSRPPAWDLLRQSPRVWDRNARIDDRQLFLDGLLTPADRLIITASTRNVRTKKTEPFSSCVDELLRVAVSMGTPREALVIEHRLQPFASDYFREDGPTPRSFSSEFAEVSRELETAGGGAKIPLWETDGETAPAAPLDLSLWQLVNFWKDPARAFLKTQGIAIPGDEEDDESLDRAEVSLGSLEAWSLRNSIVTEISSGDADLERMEAVFRANRGLPPGHLGTSVWAANRAASEPLGQSLKAQLGEKVPKEYFLPEGVRIIDSIQKTKSGDHLLAFRPKEFQYPKDFLAPWIHAVFAAACGESCPSDLFDPSNAEVPRELPAIAPEDAKTILASLVGGFIEGRNRPLRYAPSTSNVLAKAMEQETEEDPLSKAADEWGKEGGGFGAPGEGTTPAALWAWRDRDPFADPDAWHDWAERIAMPLRTWGEIK